MYLLLAHPHSNFAVTASHWQCQTARHHISQIQTIKQ